MKIPHPLLFAVSSQGGGQLALIVGAGCSVESPTSIPVASTCSEEVHRRLVEDGLLEEGDCKKPRDLGELSEVVYTKTQSQRAIVERLLDHYPLKLATPNEGYLIAAALLIEGVVVSLVTLNFDLAISAALSQLGAAKVGVVERPADMGHLKTTNVYYIHRNANETDCEKWVLRTSVLQSEWEGNWEAVVATKVLATPVVVFAGLGSPTEVLLRTTELLRKAVPSGSAVFQVDVADRANSGFCARLGLTTEAYIQGSWGDFMREVAERHVVKQVDAIRAEIKTKAEEDGLEAEETDTVLSRFQGLGLINGGRVRGYWMVKNRTYLASCECDGGLLADLLLGLATLQRVSSAEINISIDGVVEFFREDRMVAAVLVASGSGHRSRAALETELSQRLNAARYQRVRPRAAVMFGTSDVQPRATPPPDIVRGTDDVNDILAPSTLAFFHICDLRSDTSQIEKVVP